MLYINYTSMLLFTTTLTLHTVTRGGFRGGVRGVRPPLKFAKHMLYNVN
jgi:hypothetical protein